MQILGKWSSGQTGQNAILGLVKGFPVTVGSF